MKGRNDMKTQIERILHEVMNNRNGKNLLGQRPLWQDDWEYF